MKKKYETPNVEIIDFNFRDQIVVASGGGTGDYGSAAQLERCQQGSTSCSYYYVRPSGCSNLPEE